jgi:hypothetical protein
VIAKKISIIAFAILFTNLIYGNDYKEILKFEYVVFEIEEDHIAKELITFSKCFKYSEKENIESVFKEFIELHEEGKYSNFKIYKISRLSDYCIYIEGIK